MFPSAIPTGSNKQERQLIRLFKQLNEVDQQSLTAFAEFLTSRRDTSNDKEKTNLAINSDNNSTKPLSIPRPEEESVIKAIKRLTATYPMVDKETILHPISNLMTSHIIQGKEAKSVIDELETLFLKEYNSQYLDKENPTNDTNAKENK